MTQSSSPAGEGEILARLNERMNALEQDWQAVRAGVQAPAPPDLGPFEARLDALTGEVRAALAEVQVAEERRAQTHQAQLDALVAATADLTGLRAAAERQAQANQAQFDAALAEIRAQVAAEAGELTNRANEAEARLGRAVTAANLLIGRGGEA